MDHAASSHTLKIKPYILSIAAGLVWLATLFVIIKYLRHAIHDPDIWWHLAQGRAMIETHRFLRTDIFSHTMAGASWINFEWLSQIILYAIFKYFSLNGIYIAKTVAGFLCLLLFFLNLRRIGLKGPLFWVFCFAGYHLLQLRICTRIELATLAFLSFYLLLITLIRSNSLSPQKLPIILFTSTVFWVNIHGGFIFGLGLIVFLNLGARWSGEDKNLISALNLSIMACFAGSFFNPHGYKIYHVLTEHLLQLNQNSSFIQEWGKPTLKTAPIFWLSFIFSAIGIAQSLVKKKKPAYFFIPGAAVFMIWGCLSLRNTAISALILFPFAAHILTDLLKTSPLKNVYRSSTFFLWSLCGICLFIVDKNYFLKRLPSGIVDWNQYPSGAAEFVQQNDLKGRLFNSYGFGGYLSWALGPDIKIFMDGRYIFHPILSEFQKKKMGGDGPLNEFLWREYFEKYNINYAIQAYDPLRLMKSNPSDPFYFSLLDIMYPPKEWALVYWDDVSLVFVKRASENKPLIRKNEYAFLAPYNLERTFFNLRNDPQKIQWGRQELERHKKCVPSSKRAEHIETLLSRL